MDPTCHPSPPARPSSAAPPPPPAAPRAAQPYLGCHPSFYHPAIISTSLIPPLNLTPAFNGVNTINAAVTPPATPLWCSPGPYKRAMRPPTHTHLIPSLPSSFAPSFTLVTSSSRRRSLPPVHHLSVTLPSPVSTSLAPPRPAHPPPPSLASTGELQRPRAAHRRGTAAPSIRGPPWTGAVRGPPHRGLGPPHFPLKI
jgi:hypothetical protein